MPNLLFGWDTPATKAINSFSDGSINKYMTGADAPEITPDGANHLLAEIIGLRGQGRDEQAKSACTYLRFAQGHIQPTDLGRAACYHRAANDLRGLDALDKSAQCYYSAAAVAFLETPTAYPGDDPERKRVDAGIDLALRSAGRAKAQYEAIGMDDEADEAHRLQQEIIRRRYSLECNPLSFLLWIWRGATGYGTSARRWLAWITISLLAFSGLYWALFATQAISLANGAPFTTFTPIYLSVMNLVAFGAYTQIIPSGWLAECTLVAQAFVSFVLVGTGFTFLTRR